MEARGWMDPRVVVVVVAGATSAEQGCVHTTHVAAARRQTVRELRHDTCAQPTQTGDY